ncbi:hypothetical protein [Agrococcus sp. DT81.2]|uniref:hypothetical protein n=1 Tax=Agrococcus sp. DT81.2 TaxID=3393414 RepID=UPI003CE4A8A7
MSQTLVQGTTASDRTLRGSLTWISPGVDLWVASRSDADGVHYLGFVERSLDDYVAVDGTGASLGRHADLESAKRAVRGANEPTAATPAHWSDTGAPVLTVRALRAR